jgi:large subunit ribosomal protein L17
MRHGKKVNHLGRKKGHRTALLKNLSIALITHKRIFTTLAKGKALRVHLEPIVTKTKSDSTHARRVAFSYLQNKEAIKELFEVVGPRVREREGGYLRVIKTGFRAGDSAEMCFIEFVDFNETVLNRGEVEAGKKRTRRSRRSKSAGDSVAQSENTAAGTAEDGLEKIEE